METKEQQPKLPKNKKSQLKNSFNSWLSNASAGGLNRLPDARPIALGFWLLIVVLAYGALTFHCYTLVANYFSYPVNTAISLEKEVTEMPDVTICRPGILLDDKRKELPVFEKYTYYIWQIPYQLVKNMDKQRYKLDYFHRASIYKNFHNYSTQLVEMLMRCTYQGIICGVRNFKKFIHPIMLDCFTFQPQDREIYHPGLTLSLTLYSYKGSSNQQWIYGKGETLVTIHEKDSLPNVLRDGKVISPGAKNKIFFSSKKIVKESTPLKPCKDSLYYDYGQLGKFIGSRVDAFRKYAQKEMRRVCKCESPFLMFRSNKSEDTNCFKLPNVYKYQTMLRYFLSKNNEYGLEPMLMRRPSDSDKDPKWLAFDEMSKKWDENKQKMTCHQQMLTELDRKYLHIKSPTRCKQYNYKVSYTTTEIGFTVPEMVDFAGDKTSKAKTLSEAKEYIAENNMTSLPLYPALQEILSEMKKIVIKYRKLPIYVDPEKAKRDFRSSVMQLDIIAEDAPSDLIEESMAYPFVSFLSEFGGTLGLWTGISIISLFELLELLGMVFGIICLSKSREEDDHQEVEQEAML